MGPEARNISGATKTVAPLTITWAAVFLEVSLLVWCLLNRMPLWAAPAILGGLHAGGMLVRRPWCPALPRWCTGQVAVLGGVALFIGLHQQYLLIVMGGAAALNAAIQVVRKENDTGKSLRVWQKASAKIVGMASASAAAWPTYAEIVLFVSIVIAAAMFQLGRSTARRTASARHIAGVVRYDLLWFEVFHQSHYFAYVYVFWWKLDDALFPYTGFWFIAGWVVYFVLEWFLEEQARLYHLSVVAGGHIVCAVALLGMSVTTETWWILTLWALTGLGGGTCYTVRNIRHAGDTQFFDDIGHLIGCAGAVLLVLVIARTEAAIVLGALLALGAAASVTVGRWRFA